MINGKGRRDVSAVESERGVREVEERDSLNEEARKLASTVSMQRSRHVRWQCREGEVDYRNGFPTALEDDPLPNELVGLGPALPAPSHIQPSRCSSAGRRSYKRGRAAASSARENGAANGLLLLNCCWLSRCLSNEGAGAEKDGCAKEASKSDGGSNGRGEGAFRRAWARRSRSSELSTSSSEGLLKLSSDGGPWASWAPACLRRPAMASGLLSRCSLSPSPESNSSSSSGRLAYALRGALYAPISTSVFGSARSSRTVRGPWSHSTVRAFWRVERFWTSALPLR